MTTVTRKRKAPEPSVSAQASSSRSDNEESGMDIASTSTSESKQLGIKTVFTGNLYDDNDDATVIMPNLPNFTTIHQTSTGYYVCPLNGCDHQRISMAGLKIHYRSHCGQDYRPFKCIFPVVCEYAAISRGTVEGHIRSRHIPPDNADLDPSDFVEVRTDWLEIEDALFSSAQVISAPVIQRARPFECTFAKCSKKFATIAVLRHHLRTHTQATPFKCSYPKCIYTAAQKGNIYAHIYSVHFNIQKKKFKNVSNETKQRAEQYVVINQEELDIEETQTAMARIGTKQKRKKKNCRSIIDADDDFESPDISMVPFENSLIEDEDRKDELDALLQLG